ncbi:MAG: hypothetical protein F6K56_27820 [Moorea sp. SIO3G5]|nr:hypothetical protein [Moorena sp. SIO3G5]
MSTLSTLGTTDVPKKTPTDNGANAFVSIQPSAVSRQLILFKSQVAWV